MIKKNIFSGIQWTSIKTELQKRSQLYLIMILLTLFVVFILGFFTNLFANQILGEQEMNVSLYEVEEPNLENNFSVSDIQRIQETSVEQVLDMEQPKIEEREVFSEARAEVPEDAKSKVAAIEESPEQVAKKGKRRSLTDQDLEALYRIVEAEATQEDIVGRILIANVIFNRVDHDGFPNTIYDVIHHKIKGRAQFSPIDDRRYFTVTVSDKTKEAVKRALDGEDYSEGALFFAARSMASQKAMGWFDRNLKQVKKHGIHEFFTY